jgi:hypothetical protein
MGPVHAWREPPRHRRRHRGPAGLHGPQTLRGLLPRALVVACLAGGTTAYLAHGEAAREGHGPRATVTHDAEQGGHRP